MCSSLLIICTSVSYQSHYCEVVAVAEQSHADAPTKFHSFGSASKFGEIASEIHNIGTSKAKNTKELRMTKLLKPKILNFLQ